MADRDLLDRDHGHHGRDGADLDRGLRRSRRRRLVERPKGAALMPQKPPAPRPAPPRRDADCLEFMLEMREWRNPDNPVWKCGCPRLQILHSTKAKAFEGSPFLDCFTCGEKRRARVYAIAAAGFLVLELVAAVLLVAWRWL